MTTKTVACTIERRLLVNYRIEPELVPRLVCENAAHRFAVEWDDANGTQVGVYVPGVIRTPGSPLPPEAKSSPVPTGSPASRSANPAATCASTSAPATARCSLRSPPPRPAL